jgi:hypothetical protein
LIFVSSVSSFFRVSRDTRIAAEFDFFVAGFAIFFASEVSIRVLPFFETSSALLQWEEDYIFIASNFDL